MDDAIKKQGPACIQQQRFGKRWKRVWLMLFMESSRSIARLEYFDCKDNDCAPLDRRDKALKKQQESKKVIRLSDCIHVTEAEGDGCPRDKSPFLVETTDKFYVFAVDTHQLEDWMRTLCETAFPTKKGSLQKEGRNDEEGMEDNSLYGSRQTLHDFRVCVRKNQAAERCGLAGVCVLRTDASCLHLLDPNTHQLLYSWPYHFLRRFGRDKTSFSFEAGRRCESGEGSFEFDTAQSNALFKALDTAIKAQVLPQGPGSGADHSSPEISQHRALHMPQQPDQEEECAYSKVDDFDHTRDKGDHKISTLPLSHLESPADNVLIGVKSLTLATRAIPIPHKTQVKSILSCPSLSSNLDPAVAPDPGPFLGATSNPDLEKTYAQVSKVGGANGASGRNRETRKPKPRGRDGGSGSPCRSAPPPQEPAYSLPFDHIAARGEENGRRAPSGHAGAADPLYDFIDDLQVERALKGAAPHGYGRAEHIYDQPEGYSAPASMYDDPEEVRADAWRTMGIDVDATAYSDAYAVPKVRRELPAPPPGAGREGTAGGKNPYKNVADSGQWDS